MSPLKKNQKLFYIRQKQNIRHSFNPAQERTLPFSILLLFHTTCSKTKTKKKTKKTHNNNQKTQEGYARDFQKNKLQMWQEKGRHRYTCVHTHSRTNKNCSFILSTDNKLYWEATVKLGNIHGTLTVLSACYIKKTKHFTIAWRKKNLKNTPEFGLGSVKE